MTQPELSADQGDVYRDLLAFAATRASKRPYLVLHGLAGTGKTTVLSKLAHDLPGAILCAFTGKAASVLRSKTALEVSTLHSVIYDFKGLTEDEIDPTRRRPVFTSKGADLTSRIVLLDECSNVGTRLAEDLLVTGARVIACGDPGQLPPVRDQQFFSEPDLTLTEVHRQAWDSAIIRQAHAVRTVGN